MNFTAILSTHGSDTVDPRGTEILCVYSVVLKFVRKTQIKKIISDLTALMLEINVEKNSFCFYFVNPDHEKSAYGEAYSNRYKEVEGGGLLGTADSKWLKDAGVFDDTDEAYDINIKLLDYFTQKKITSKHEIASELRSFADSTHALSEYCKKLQATIGGINNAVKHIHEYVTDLANKNRPKVFKNNRVKLAYAMVDMFYEDILKVCPTAFDTDDDQQQAWCEREYGPAHLRGTCANLAGTEYWETYRCARTNSSCFSL